MEEEIHEIYPLNKVSPSSHPLATTVLLSASICLTILCTSHNRIFLMYLFHLVRCPQGSSTCLHMAGFPPPPSFPFLSYSVPILCCPGDWTQGLTHGRHVLLSVSYTCSWISFFLRLNSISLYVYVTYPSSINLLAEIHYLYVSIGKDAATNIGGQISLWNLYIAYFDKYPEVKLLDYMVVAWRTFFHACCPTFSFSAHQQYI